MPPICSGRRWPVGEFGGAGNLISQHPSVASVAVIGIPDPQGEQPLALVVCCDGVQLDQPALARAPAAVCRQWAPEQMGDTTAATLCGRDPQDQCRQDRQEAHSPG
nr:hypothetical protein [Pseudomonas kurunegalensis]